MLGAVTNLETLTVRLTADGSRLLRTFDLVERRIMVGSERIMAQTQRMHLGLFAPLSTLATIGLYAYSTFDQAMTEALAVVENTTEAMEKNLKDAALRLSMETKWLPQELARGYYFLFQAGMQTEQAMKALPVVSKFAMAGAMDLARATEYLVDSVSSMGMLSNEPDKLQKNMERTANVLAYAANKVQGSVKQMAEALRGRAGAYLRAMNKDLEEGVAVLMAFHQQGIKSGQAGTWLTMVLRDLQKSSTGFLKGWKQYGISPFDANKNFLPVADIIQQLEGVYNGLNDMQKGRFIKALGFQHRSWQAILQLMGKSQDLREFQRMLDEAGGTIDRMANKQMESFINQMKKFRNQLYVTAMDIGEVIAPAIMKFTEVVADGMRWWRSLDKELRRTVIIFGVIVGAINPVLYILSKVWYAISGWVGMGAMVVRFLLTPFVLVGKVLAGVVMAGLGTVGRSLVGMATAVTAVGTAIGSRFAGAMRVAIGYSRNLSALSRTAFAAMGTAARFAGQEMQYWGRSLHIYWDSFKRLPWIVEQVKFLKSVLWGFARVALPEFLNLGRAISNFRGLFHIMSISVKDGIMMLFQNFWKFTASTGHIIGAISLIMAAFHPGLAVAMWKVSAVLTVLIPVARRTFDSFISMMRRYRHVWGPAWDDMKRGAMAAINATTKAFRDQFGRVAGWVKTNVTDKVSTAWQTGMLKVQNTIANTSFRITKYFVGMWRSFDSSTKFYLKMMAANFQGNVARIVGYFRVGGRAAGMLFVGAISNAGRMAASALTASMRGAFAVIRAGAAGVGSFVRSSLSSVSTAIGSLTTLMMVGGGGALSSSLMTMTLIVPAAMSLMGAMVSLPMILGSVAAAWLTLTEEGRSWADWVLRGIMPTIEILKEAFVGVKAALASGNFKDAAETAWLGLKVAFYTALRDMEAAWKDHIRKVINAISEIAKAFGSMWSDAQAGITKALLRGGSYDMGVLERKILGFDPRQVIDKAWKDAVDSTTRSAKAAGERLMGMTEMKDGVRQLLPNITKEEFDAAIKENEKWTAEFNRLQEMAKGERHGMHAPVAWYEEWIEKESKKPFEDQKKRWTGIVDSATDAVIKAFETAGDKVGAAEDEFIKKVIKDQEDAIDRAFRDKWKEEGVLKGMEDDLTNLHDQFDKPFIANFGVDGVDALEVGSAAAARALEKYIRGLEQTSEGTQEAVDAPLRKVERMGARSNREAEAGRYGMGIEDELLSNAKRSLAQYEAEQSRDPVELELRNKERQIDQLGRRDLKTDKLVELLKIIAENTTKEDETAVTFKPANLSQS